MARYKPIDTRWGWARGDESARPAVKRRRSREQRRGSAVGGSVATASGDGTALQLRLQGDDQPIGNRWHGDAGDKGGKLRDRHAGVAAGVDRGEGCQIHCDVEREPVVAAIAFDLEAERSDLRAADIGAGRSRQPLGVHAVIGQQVDYGLLHAIDQRLHREAAALEVEQQVADDLAGAVVGDLPATVDLDDGHADVPEQVFRLAGKALREHRRMLAEPQFVGRAVITLGGKGLHRTPGRFIVDPAQLANYKTIFTHGWLVSSR